MTLRAVYLLCRLVVHVFYGLFIVLLLWPFMGRLGRHRTEKRWAKDLLAVLNIRVEIYFETPLADYAKHGPMLIFSNHVSWLDIFAFNAHSPITFIAKSEIASWPIAGFLARKSGTLFIERGRRQAVREVIDKATSVLKEGQCVAVFPEGTTSIGEAPLPFHSNFVQPALNAQVQVLPVSLQYFTLSGHFTAEPAFVGEQTLWENMQVLLARPEGYVAKLFFHDPIRIDPSLSTRRHLSDQAYEVIVAHCKKVIG